MKGSIFLRSFTKELALFIPLEEFAWLVRSIEYLNENTRTIKLRDAQSGFSVVDCHLRDSHKSQNVTARLKREVTSINAWKRLSAKRVARSLLAIAASKYHQMPKGDAWVRDEVLHQRLHCALGFFFAQACPRSRTLENVQATYTADHRHGALMLHSLQGLDNTRLLRVREAVKRHKIPSIRARFVGYLIEILGGLENPPNSFEFYGFVSHLESPGRTN